MSSMTVALVYHLSLESSEYRRLGEEPKSASGQPASETKGSMDLRPMKLVKEPFCNSGFVMLQVFFCLSFNTRPCFGDVCALLLGCKEHVENTQGLTNRTQSVGGPPFEASLGFLHSCNSQL